MGNAMLRSLSALALLGAVASAPAAAARPNDSFSVTNVRVFDGRRVSPHATVVVSDGEIVAVG